MKQKKVIVIVSIFVIVGFVGFFALQNNEKTEPAIDKTVDNNSAAEPVEETEPPALITSENETIMPEIVYVPDNPEIPTGQKQNPSLNVGNFKSSNKSIQQIRTLVETDDLGGYINPRLSPDGLQVMLTRPGFQGIYVLGVFGNDEPRLVANVNSYTAKWTSDGRILVEVNNEELRLYNLDGTIEYSEELSNEDGVAFSKDDVIYVASESGEAGIPITDNSDRYIAPTVSPNEDKVAYIGLQTGLYVAPTDGSAEPTFLGEGYNVTWANDGSSLVFNRPTDDGHYILESDIYQYEFNSGELTNLTEGTDLIGQYPTIGPDGESIAFEAEGSIYIGVIE